MKNRSESALYTVMMRRVLRSNTENLASSIQKRGKNYDSSIFTRERKMVAIKKKRFPLAIIS